LLLLEQTEQSDIQVIKVLQPDETVSENPITEVDRGVVSVLNALEKVEAQITSIEKQINR
jgi:charged multivesicular body protein 7